MRRLLPLLLLLPALPLLGACDEGLGPDSDESGTYELASVNGRTLPTRFFSVEVLFASLKLNPDRTFETKSTVRGKDNLGEMVTQTKHDAGTYTRTENTVRLTSKLGNVTIGTYAGPTITVNPDTVAMVYRRKPGG